MNRKLELVLYLAGFGLVFFIDWRFGIANLLIYLADTLKTIRMMKRHDKHEI